MEFLRKLLVVNKNHFSHIRYAGTSSHTRACYARICVCLCFLACLEFYKFLVKIACENSCFSHFHVRVCVRDIICVCAQNELFGCSLRKATCETNGRGGFPLVLCRRRGFDCHHRFLVFVGLLPLYQIKADEKPATDVLTSQNLST